MRRPSTSMQVKYRPFPLRLSFITPKVEEEKGKRLLRGFWQQKQAGDLTLVVLAAAGNFAMTASRV